jgi:hypothetical protein
MASKLILHLVIATCLAVFVNSIGVGFMSPSHYNYLLAFLLVWVTGDGTLTAHDLKAAEGRIKCLNEKVKDLIACKGTNKIGVIKKIEDNHQLMLELRTRLLNIQKHLNSHGLHAKTLTESRSLDSDIELNLDLFTSNIDKRSFMKIKDRKLREDFVI